MGGGCFCRFSNAHKLHVQCTPKYGFSLWRWHRLKSALLAAGNLAGNGISSDGFGHEDVVAGNFFRNIGGKGSGARFEGAAGAVKSGGPGARTDPSEVDAPGTP